MPFYRVPAWPGRLLGAPLIDGRRSVCPGPVTRCYNETSGLRGPLTWTPADRASAIADQIGDRSAPWPIEPRGR